MHAERGHDLNHRRRLRLGPRRRRRFHSRESRRPEPACGRGAAGRQPGRIRLHRNPAKTGAACADRLRRNPTRPAYRHARTRSGASPRLPPARRTAAWMPGFESGHDGGCVRARRAGDRPGSARAAFGFAGLRRKRGPFAALDFSGKRLRSRRRRRRALHSASSDSGGNGGRLRRSTSAESGCGAAPPVLLYRGAGLRLGKDAAPPPVRRPGRRKRLIGSCPQPMILQQAATPA